MKEQMYNNFGCAAIILALCLGVASCSFADHYGSRWVMERCK